MNSQTGSERLRHPSSILDSGISPSDRYTGSFFGPAITSEDMDLPTYRRDELADKAYGVDSALVDPMPTDSLEAINKWIIDSVVTSGDTHFQPIYDSLEERAQEAGMPREIFSDHARSVLQEFTLERDKEPEPPKRKFRLLWFLAPKR